MLTVSCSMEAVAAAAASFWAWEAVSTRVDEVDRLPASSLVRLTPWCTLPIALTSERRMLSSLCSSTAISSWPASTAVGRRSPDATRSALATAWASGRVMERVMAMAMISVSSRQNAEMPAAILNSPSAVCSAFSAPWLASTEDW